jgi:Ca2+-transporting ATPase
MDVHAANNVLFYTIILSQLLHALNMNEGKEKFIGGPVMRNLYLLGSIVLSAAVTLLCLAIPPVKEALRLEMMPRLDWLLVAGFSLAGMLVIRVGAAIFGK